MITKKRFFLASSDELAAERDWVELLIRRRNSVLVDSGLFLEVVRWEEMLQTFHENRIQDRFSAEVVYCDAMIVLFHTRVGRFTKEEFDIAYRSFKAGINPRHILVYFKDTPVNIGDLDEEMLAIFKMKRQIVEADGQFFVDFRSKAELQVSLTTQLDHLCALFMRKMGLLVPSPVVIEFEASQIPTDPQAAKKVLDQRESWGLAERAGILRKWTVNPVLAFNGGDVSFFFERRYPRYRLEAEFRARRVVLESAELEKVYIPTQGDLSEMATPIVARILREWQKRVAEEAPDSRDV